MANDYLNQKIAEAIRDSGGDKHDAQKLLITRAVRDQQLMLAIAKPHLKAIVTGLIDHALRPQSPHDPGPDKISRTAIDDIVASATLRVPTDKRRKSNLPPPKETERQAFAMRKIADAFSKKKK